jgi:gas vesicle protein
MFKILLFPVKATRTFVRLAGIRGALLLAVGVAIGLLIAPTSGARLRAKLAARFAESRDAVPADADMVV